MTNMKAVRIHQYGGQEMLSYEDAPMPQPAPGEVLIKVAATSVNQFDIAARSGYVTGYYQYPLPHIPGLDVSGSVEATGDENSQFSRGDEVYARSTPGKAGEYAQYIVLPEDLVARKPASLNSVEAAAVPHATISAWKAIVDTANLSQGQSILIHAAAGGVGSMAVQMAKRCGAYVIGTASPANHEFLRGLGVDETIDYNTVRFEEVVHDMDVVLDLVGNMFDNTYSRSWQVLKPGGLLMSLLEFPGPQSTNEQGTRAVMVIGDPCDGEFLTRMGELFNKKELVPVVSDVIPMENVRQAHLNAERHHVRGKLVMQVNQEQTSE